MKSIDLKISFKTRTYIASALALLTTVLLLVVPNHEGKIFLRLILGGVVAYTLLFYLFKTGTIDYRKQHTFSRILLYVASIFTLVAGINYYSQFNNVHHSYNFFVINGHAWLVDFFGIVLAGLLFYIVFSSFYLLWEKKKQTENQSVKAELFTLRNQINPHFYFNTLNNLYSLIKIDQDKAQDFVLKLSNLMRYTIYKGEQKYVTLSDEVEYLRDYVDLQTSRFEKDINVNFRTEIHNPETKVSPLLFINLLENAFKHGIENVLTDGHIDIKLEEQDGEIDFHIANNYESPHKVKRTKGIGLKNLKESLNLLYPNSHILRINNMGDRFIVDLRIST